MFGLIRSWWSCQQFDPSWMGLLVNPFYFARRGLVIELRPLFPLLGDSVLDVGCGRKPYRRHISAPRYVGLDVDSPVTRELAMADIYYDGGVFPVSDCEFEGVLCSQVFEHVFQPKRFLAEIHRVLRPGGALLITMPFVWDEHEQPYDYARYSSFGIRACLEEAGFEIEIHRKSMPDFRAVIQLSSAWVYKVTRSKLRGLNLFSQLVLIAPINAMGWGLSMILPRNGDFYLDNVVLARKPRD